MSTLNSSKNMSLLTMILPRESVGNVSASISEAGASGIVQISARGSVLNEGGGLLQKMFPPPAPEQQILQVLIADNDKDKIIDRAIKSGNLDKVGAGAVFSISCNEVNISSAFPTLVSDSDSSSSTHPVGDLEAICCICEIGVADDIAKAALQNGAPGPTVTFGEGGGIRDKIPLLRITKGPEKEFVWCVVEKSESDEIFAAMARAGRITEPGRGFMYSIPVSSGLINISSTVSSTAHGANMEQIIAAVDDLKGSKEWRQSLDSGKTKSLKTTYLENLVGIYCIVPRDNYSEVYDSILESGAPGVSTNFGVMIDTDSDQGQNEEWALVYTSVGANGVDDLRIAVEKKISESKIDRFAFYTLPIPRALTYLGG